MPSIVILTGALLCHNPRVIKEAAALTEAGYAVEILGGWVDAAWWLDAAFKERDKELLANAKFKFTPVIDLTQTSSRTRIQRLAYRLRTKLGQMAFRHMGIGNHWQLGYAVTALERAARRSRADLFIAHSEPALWVAERLHRTGYRVGLDMEDWFSDDLLPKARKRRPVKLLRSLEAKLLREAVHSTCTSRVMSAALANEYNCRPPAVVYNAFPWADRQRLDGQLKDRKDRSVPSIHWYSQSLGYGRGLEDLLAALPCLKHPAEIHLRGNPVDGFGEWLQARLPAPWRERVFLHALVSNDELFSRIAEHDIGFAGEMKYCRSRDLTVTNKILHYLLGGLAVVASDTAGQSEIAQQAKGAVRLYPSGNPQALAAELNALLASSDELSSAKSSALAAAEKSFCWERQVPILLASIENAFTG